MDRRDRSRPRDLAGPTRRSVLAASLLAPVAARGQGGPAEPVPPILFVHGNGDTAALWLTTLWRFETNGVGRDRMLALDIPDPLARSDDAVPQPNRSSTEDQRRAVAEGVRALRDRTGAARVALVGNSRGGYGIRSYIRSGASDVSHAILCGVPNHGVHAWDEGLGSEFNGRGPFLSGLNGGPREADEGPAWLTLRSDGYDKFAQSDGAALGRPGRPTHVTSDGPALTGATNLVLGRLDHREVAYGPRAFAEMIRFLPGRPPDRLAIVPETRVVLDGLVTGLAGGVATNRPVAGATVEIHRVDPETGERRGDMLHGRTTGADGRWGAVTVAPTDALEFVLAVPGHPTAHLYRSPFPRSSEIVHLRPPRPLAGPDAAAGAVVTMVRPRGYFGLPRDAIALDGRVPGDVTPGVPVDAATTVRLDASGIGRPVVGQFRLERIVARAWPASENRIAIVELTG